MGTALRVLAVLVVAGVLVGIGAGVYNAGVSQGVAQSATLATASGTPAVIGWYGAGPHWGWGWGGFGFFGIFFWILGIFLVFALLRFAFGWGRWGRHGDHWNGSYGPYDGPRGFGGRRDALASLHRELHEQEAARSSGGGSAPAGGAPAA